MDDLGSNEFIKQLGSGVVSNLIFVVGYLVSIALKKRHKKSHCKMCCCEIDLEAQTIRENPVEQKENEGREREI